MGEGAANLEFSWSQMLSELRLGLDVDPDTDWRTVPHIYDAAHTPRYALWRWADEEDDWVLELDENMADVSEMVQYAHFGPGFYRLTEDGYPVFTRG